MCKGEGVRMKRGWLCGYDFSQNIVKPTHGEEGDIFYALFLASCVEIVSPAGDNGYQMLEMWNKLMFHYFSFTFIWDVDVLMDMENWKFMEYPMYIS